jgi:hypothetical protein
MIGQTPWNTDEAAELMACHRNHTTARLTAFAQRLAELLSQTPETFSPCRRPDRITEAAVAMFRIGGRLAERDPQRFRQWVRSLVEGKTA